MRPLAVSLLVLGRHVWIGEAVADEQDKRFTVHVIVNGVSPNTGTVETAIFDSAEEFPDGEQVASASGSADGSGKARLQFSSLKAGAYAISLYHDANGNGQFDQDGLGIPKEKYGFSNNADIDLSAPSFEEAKFDVKGDTTLEIDLKSWN